MRLAIYLRISAGLKERLQEQAVKNGRSLNSEIVQRLKASLEPEPIASRKAPDA